VTPNLSPDGTARLVVHPVRTRRVDVDSGEETVVLEGWWQTSGAWLADGTCCVLCSKGEVELDRDEPEVSTLSSLDAAFGANQRRVRVESSGLLHMLDGRGGYLYNIEVDADTVESSPDGCIVVLRRKRRRGGQWRTMVLAFTPRGLVPVRKYAEDIDPFGEDRTALDQEIAAAGTWRLTVVRDGMQLEPPPPPPAQRIEVGDAGLTLELCDGATAPKDDESADDEPVWDSWSPVLSKWRGDDLRWELVRLFKADCELMRFERTNGEWQRTGELPVEGFDRSYPCTRGRLVVVTIDNAPPDMAWSMFVGVDAGGVLRCLGRTHHTVTAAWDEGDETRIALLGGTVYRVVHIDEAISAATARESRPLLALVFDVDGHYGKREFLPRFGHDFGFIDRAGALAIEHRYTSVQPFEDGLARVAHAGPRLFGLIDTNGATVVPHHYSWIGEDRDGYRAIARGEPSILGERPKAGAWGLLGPDGDVVLEPVADVVRDVREGRAAVRREDGWNLLTTGGEWLLEREATKCGNFHDGLCPVAIDDVWGFVDRAGVFVIEPRFEGAGEVRGGLAGVKLPGAGWSFVDATGVVVSDRAYDAFFWHSEGLARVRVGDKWGYVDAHGALVVDPRFDEAFDFSCGIASVRVGDRWTWIDSTGEYIAEPRFDRTYDARDGSAIFKAGPFHGYMRTDGSVLAEGFEVAQSFVDGRARVQKRARWGFIDDAGQVAVRLRMSSALDFSEGLAAVKYRGKWGYVDAGGDMVIEPAWGTPGSFRCGRAKVQKVYKPST
jgi:hypothetical protein